RLAGKAEKKIADITPGETFALKPTDLVGLKRPKVVVNEGDKVKAGRPLFFDRQEERVLYTSPVSGEVVEIKRGDKRKLLEIRILADKTIEYETFPKLSSSEISSLSKEA